MNTSIPGMPDYYWDFRTPHTHGEACYRVGDPRGDPGWGIVTNRPFEGRNCLRLKGRQCALLFQTAPRLERPTPFTLSVYARADRDGASLRFYGPEDHSRPTEHRLSTQWQRVSELIMLPAQMPWNGYRLGFVTGNNPDTVWLDAMQLEADLEAAAEMNDPLAGTGNHPAAALDL